jgi:hypothetical protein
MATYPDDANLSGRKPDKNFSLKKKYSATVFESESGYEKRQLKSRRPKRTIELSYTKVSSSIKNGIEDFYDNRSGEFESFYFDLAHLNETGIIRTRFKGELDIETIHSIGSEDNFYNVKFTLQETYD